MTAPLAIPTQGGGVTGNLYVGQAKTLVMPGEPGIAELVVDDGEGFVPLRGVDVIGPEGAALVEMLVGVDHRGHLANLTDRVAE